MYWYSEILRKGDCEMLKKTINKFELTITPLGDRKAIRLSWHKPDEENNYIYKIYGRHTGEKDEFSELRQYKIRVLEVHPGEAHLRNWVSEYGLGQIECNTMYIDEFNKRPEEMWNYDVIAFGFADVNGNKDLNMKSAIMLKEYIRAGGGVLFGHDTVMIHKKHFQAFAPDLNLMLEESDNRQITWCSTICIAKKGLLTTTPYELGKINTKYRIPTSHSYFQYPYGDVWVKFESDQSPYLTTWKNCALIQTGHANGEATDEEQKLVINTIFYLARNLKAETYLNENTEVRRIPTMPQVEVLKVEGEKISFNIKEAESGIRYEYYVEATRIDTGYKMKSTIESIHIGPSIIGYAIVMDTNPDTIPNDIVTVEGNSYEGTLTSLGGVYIHIKAIDELGKSSETLHYFVKSKLMKAGKVYKETEIGWQRFDDRDPHILKIGENWTYETESSMGTYKNTQTMISGSNSRQHCLMFNFVGTRLRVIQSLGSNYSTQVVCEIDGIPHMYSVRKNVRLYQVLTFEKIGLPYGEHQVKIYAKDGAKFDLDAIEIDVEGKIM